MKDIWKQPLWILFFISIISSLILFVFVSNYPTPENRPQITATSTEISALVWMLATIFLFYITGQTLFRKTILFDQEKEGNSGRNMRNILYSLSTLFVFWLGSGFGSFIEETFQQSVFSIFFAITPAILLESLYVRNISLSKKISYLSGTLGFLILLHSIVLIAFVRVLFLDGLD